MLPKLQASMVYRNYKYDTDNKLNYQNTFKGVSYKSNWKQKLYLFSLVHRQDRTPHTAAAAAICARQILQRVCVPCWALCVVDFQHQLHVGPIKFAVRAVRLLSSSHALRQKMFWSDMCTLLLPDKGLNFCHSPRLQWHHFGKSPLVSPNLLVYTVAGQILNHWHESHEARATSSTMAH